jgi:hypothetical protein
MLKLKFHPNIALPVLNFYSDAALPALMSKLFPIIRSKAFAWLLFFAQD